MYTYIRISESDASHFSRDVRFLIHQQKRRGHNRLCVSLPRRGKEKLNFSQWDKLKTQPKIPQCSAARFFIKELREEFHQGPTRKPFLELIPWDMFRLPVSPGIDVFPVSEYWSRHHPKHVLPPLAWEYRMDSVEILVEIRICDWTGGAGMYHQVFKLKSPHSGNKHRKLVAV